jgi:acylphosphatase
MTKVEKARVRLIISGRVQGVFFRASTLEEALGLGLSGWVRNLPDGGVEVLAEGEGSNIQKLIDWCHHGPPYAQVALVEVSEESYSGEFNGFHVRY